MTTKAQSQNQVDWRSDWWLWPAAFLLAMGGLGQAVWMWDNIQPSGMAPLWLLVWIGIGVAGVTLPVYWFVRRWWPAAWIAASAWLGAPRVYEMALRTDLAARTGTDRLYRVSPFLLMLLLGVGLSGVMMGVSWYVGRRWSGPMPSSRALREGFWSGLFVAMCGWLLINRLFTVASVGILAWALVLIEAYLVIRESTLPKSDKHQTGSATRDAGGDKPGPGSDSKPSRTPAKRG